MDIGDWMIWVAIAAGFGWIAFVLTVMGAVLRVAKAAAEYLDSINEDKRRDRALRDAGRPVWD